MKISVYNIKGEATGRSVELPEEVFGIEPHEHSVWLDVKRYLAAQRQGTHKSKERSEISGSTRKLHKQKGTGGSRKGDINNPLYRGGGRVFGPRPRNYDIQVNAKVRRLARRSALSAKAKTGSIVVVEDFTFETPKTKEFQNILNALKVADKKPLTVLGNYDKTLYLSCRNIEKASIAPATDLSTYQIIQAGAVVITESAIEKIKENCA
ncbi:MAG: 50S ribosomal protein L4 [Haliscomenobacteraceae bacterium CHB4]|nr:50S ribosomal protein L4 [Saprospiraceae bacterium]MCE7925364.1 50S ribosomal protein L4 [Haliscomenobacteraceae bacterium CHB4]